MSRGRHAEIAGHQESYNRQRKEDVEAEKRTCRERGEPSVESYENESYSQSRREALKKIERTVFPGGLYRFRSDKLSHEE